MSGSSSSISKQPEGCEAINGRISARAAASVGVTFSKRANGRTAKPSKWLIEYHPTRQAREAAVIVAASSNQLTGTVIKLNLIIRSHDEGRTSR